MDSLLRSEKMTLCQMFLQSEAAYTCVSELGELGLVQFRDLNPDVNAFQRKFVNEIRRCEEMERKLRFLEKEINKDGIPMLNTGDNPDAPAPREMIDLEATFEKLENEMKEVNSNSEALKRNFLELTELKHILRKTQTFFDEALHDPSITEERIGLLGDEQQPRAGQPMRLGFVAGVILRERIPSFEVMLWRICRGNVFLRQAEIDSPMEDPITGDSVHKSVFILFFQGEQLKARIKKICEGYRATLYPCPETQTERREMAIGVMTRIEDLNTVLGQTQDHRHRVLVAAAKNIKVWSIKVRKIKAIYHTLNMFNLDVTQKCLIAECWCPVSDLDRIQQALRRGTERSGSSVPSIINRMQTRMVPPTYNRCNKFTQGFQNIVDAYGVACYTEINPAPFTCITFPFLFAVMFGDMGHGMIMFLFALFLVLKEKALEARKNQNEIFGTFFGGRYIILLMGAFSVYTGFIYNDIFSKPFNFFGSQWSLNKTDPRYLVVSHSDKPYLLQLDPKFTALGDTYPIGMDPLWQMSDNKIAFTNSLKMKMSVILGVSQMFFGIILGYFNHRHFKKPLNIIFDFIPMMLFLFCMFGYLIILLFVKWTKYPSTESHEAPSLLIGLIDMFLFNYGKYVSPGSHITGDQKQFIYSGQQGLQSFLVVIAVLCVPWMMLGKPFYLRYINKYGQEVPKSQEEEDEEVMFINLTIRASTNGSSATNSSNTSSSEIQFSIPRWFKHQPLSVNSGDLLGGEEVVHNLETNGPLHTEEGVEEEHFNFSETFIHQVIHTIEFCLGCISHTASYLRLWALSLAHAQLSEVLWQMVLRIGFGLPYPWGGFALVVVFQIWAGMTVVILVLMEGLSAFLHALRLHWVEFQSKFYDGTGHLFTPFSFSNLVDTGLED
ncbi:V-type proton ATPase 116 kDa subunit a 1-like isoform X2 [Physella acuta]|uniref:V-type proton ATPase 116 kDa subunit a 1-like isoform X2 n=1 Tax=Physella acuta TaxID=109671 RepID=UPI0027DB347B|nr:V-type proton ATPase 116 kDa subunit a 1-like isoform X2 [Physella acuta]